MCYVDQSNSNKSILGLGKSKISKKGKPKVKCSNRSVSKTNKPVNTFLNSLWDCGTRFIRKLCMYVIKVITLQDPLENVLAIYKEYLHCSKLAKLNLDCMMANTLSGFQESKNELDAYLKDHEALHLLMA